MTSTQRGAVWLLAQVVRARGCSPCHTGMGGDGGEGRQRGSTTRAGQWPARGAWHPARSGGRGERVGESPLVTTPAQWLAGARPRTLPAAVAPVLVGTSVAIWDGGAHWGRAVLALLVALALQAGVNYANDYSDGIRGTDADRVGPVRLVGQGLAEPHAVKRAALLCFAVAAVAGLALVVLSQLWWLLAVGAAAIVAAWTYTGGPRPYGYAGWGEVFVFVFFGLVAVCGTAVVQVGHISGLAWLCGTGVGALACAILVVNNLRDIPGDTVAGKRTLAVRLGDPATRRLYAALMAVGLGVPSAPRNPWRPRTGPVADRRPARAGGADCRDQAAANSPRRCPRSGTRAGARRDRPARSWSTACCCRSASRSRPFCAEPTADTRLPGGPAHSEPCRGSARP